MLLSLKHETALLVEVGTLHVVPIFCSLTKFFKCRYRKVASSNTSRLEAHAGFFRLLLKVIFDPYALKRFYKKLIF